MSTLQNTLYQRQFIANTSKTRVLHGTGIKIRSRETDSKKLLSLFMDWAQKYSLTYLEAFCVFNYGTPVFDDHCNEEDFILARTKLIAYFVRLSDLTINL